MKTVVSALFCCLKEKRIMPDTFCPTQMNLGIILTNCDLYRSGICRITSRATELACSKFILWSIIHHLVSKEDFWTDWRRFKSLGQPASTMKERCKACTKLMRTLIWKHKLQTFPPASHPSHSKVGLWLSKNWWRELGGNLDLNGKRCCCGLQLLGSSHPDNGEARIRNFKAV